VSSDFCHWGSRFDYIYLREPSNKGKSISTQIEELDKEGIKHIVNHDVDAFTEYLKGTENTICGRHPISVLLQCLKEQNNLELESELVRYDQSGKIKNPMRDTSVSYASIVTRQE